MYLLLCICMILTGLLEQQIVLSIYINLQMQMVIGLRGMGAMNRQALLVGILKHMVLVIGQEVQEHLLLEQIMLILPLVLPILQMVSLDIGELPLMLVDWRF